MMRPRPLVLPVKLLAPSSKQTRGRLWSGGRVEASRVSSIRATKAASSRGGTYPACFSHGLSAFFERGVQPRLYVLLVHPGHSRSAPLDRLGDPLVHPARPRRALIGLEENAGVGQFTGGGGARRNQLL